MNGRSDRQGSSEDQGVVRVIVADDDPLALRVLTDVLRLAGNTVIAGTSTASEALELTAHYQPDVLVVDMVMPEMNGLEVVERAGQLSPGTAVIILSSSDDEEIGLMAIRAGAWGYLPKETCAEALPPALEGAARGEVAISRRLATRLVEQFRENSADSFGLRPIRSSLTSREWEVLDLLCRRLSTAEIADELVVSMETVRSHIKAIFRKLGVNSREQAISAGERLRSAMRDHRRG